ncbi:MAG: succinate dehydrogenase, cytochrome b556 subunit [Sphingomicrobium sp.]
MSSSPTRPLSPHLTIWRWGPGMLVSILHRLTGGALTVVGLAILAWWLVAIAGDDESYARFIAVVGHPAGLIVLAGLTWAFWQHFFSGVRHIVLDTGAGYELKVNKFWAVMTLVGSLFATALTWYFLLGVGQ